MLCKPGLINKLCNDIVNEMVFVVFVIFDIVVLIKCGDLLELRNNCLMSTKGVWLIVALLSFRTSM